MRNIANLDTETLELNKVLELLAARTVLYDAKRKATALIPSTDIDAVRELLSQTDDAYRLAAGFGSPSFGSAHDMTNALKRAENGAVLSMSELLDIGSVLRTVRGIYEWKNHCENIEAKHIERFFDALIPNKYFEDKIFTSIRSEDEMDDNASKELKSIRRSIREAELNVRDRLEKTIHSVTMSKYLQDTIITSRDGRFVIPVKAEYRSQVPGLLHDTSGSGATLFIEPMAIVEINNKIRELKIKEKEETDRILAELSGEAAGFSENIIQSFGAAVELSLIFAKASLAVDMQATVPQLNDDGKIYLKNARHPLLDRKTAVPVTVPLGEEHDTLIITGPNTGGKTVTLKTIGLLTLMTMCGMMIPVSDGSRVSIFKNVLADIGDEQSIEQSLSTFSAHIKKIVKILECADDRSLVLVDELGAGTDPVEGAALATAILMSLREKGAVTAATTHYAELKSYALETTGVCNASCEFDVDTLRPTYRLMIGMPGRSNAFAISERLGIPKSTVDTAARLVDEGDARFERVIAGLEGKLKEADAAKTEAVRLRAEAESISKSFKQQAKELEENRRKAVENAREQAMAIVDKARAEAERMLSELESIKKSRDADAERVSKARAAVKGGVDRMLGIADPIEEDKKDYKLPRPLKKGDKVYIFDIKKEAVVLEDPKGDEVLVLAGMLKTKMKISELRLAEQNKTVPAKQRTVRRQEHSEPNVRTASSEIDIRGLNGDEAAMELDRFIDGCVLAGLNTVWIIHGKGTGALKKAVSEYLKTNRSVASFRRGLYGEGEDGVTVVTLK